MKNVKPLLLAAMVLGLFASCQPESSPVATSTGSSDLVRVAMRLATANATDTLPDSTYFLAKWVRVQFSTNTTVQPIWIDTIIPLSAGHYISPAISKSLSFNLTVSGIDSAHRHVWGGSLTGSAAGNDQVVDVLEGNVPITATPRLGVGVASLGDSIDFPGVLTFPVTNGSAMFWSADGLHWSPFPVNGMTIDSATSLLVQNRSADSLTGAPFSPVTRFTFTGKTVATPVWSVAGNRFFPGQVGGVKSALSCATNGAILQWSTDGTTWNSYSATDSVALDAGKTYQARATKAHQPTSAAAPQTWQWLSSDSAALASLSIGTATLSPAFSPSALSYVTDSVWGQAYVTVTALPKVNGVKVTCNGAACTGQQFAISDTGTFIQVTTSINGTAGLTYAVRVPKSQKVLESDYGIPWNPNITYDTLIDTRDGQKYRTVKIGTQTWMAQNLNYKTDNSTWYRDSGAKYGRNYLWADVMGVSTYYDSFALNPSLPVQGVCPVGWHVPSNAEWTKLTDTCLSSATAGTELKSTSGWLSGGNGTDRVGFRTLPVTFISVGASAGFWAASEWPSIDGTGAYTAEFAYNFTWVADGGAISKTELSSVRCIQD